MIVTKPVILEEQVVTPFEEFVYIKISIISEAAKIKTNYVEVIIIIHNSIKSIIVSIRKFASWQSLVEKWLCKNLILKR